MSLIFKLKKDDGTDSDDWGYYSESKGEIINLGPDKEKAEQIAAEDAPTETIASALADTVPPPSPIEVVKEEIIPPSETAIESTEEKPKKKKAAFTPAMLKKIVDTAGRNCTNISIELERFLIKQFGFSTEELAEDDPDVEMIKLGWDCLWQSYLEDKEPPISMILAFGYSCVTVRLIASAKRIPKEKENAEE